ncbi:MAG: lipoprotein ApbE [Cycloclasticus sp.]|nr:lipoprotein ApbE [Cycloclasticus sp.]MBG96271.1 lipoprotein ApbE [Cycloclasticus sp.]
MGFFISISFLTGCESPSSTGTFLAGQTMGTTYHITLAESVTRQIETSLKQEIDARLLEVNDSFSTYINSSEVSQFNNYKGTDWQEKSDEFMTVLAAAQNISAMSDGAYDITVGPLVNLWGFGPGFKKDNVPDDQMVKEALSKVGYKKLMFNPDNNEIKKLQKDLYVDFSSIAKGFGVDAIAELLMAKGYKHYMVEIGGEMRVSGLNPQKVKWRIAVEKPDTETRSIHRVINVSDVAIATSGDYRNYFEQDGVRFSHTINPKTGYPVQQELASVTVLAKNCMTADAWATAFMVLGYKKGYDLAIANNLAVLFLLKEGEEFKEISTPNFKKLTKEHAS